MSISQRKRALSAAHPQSASVTTPMTTAAIAAITSRKAMPSRPEMMEFAKKLKNVMAAKKMNASDLARAIWGTTTDQRGYQVAKNRDRIGTYLAGTGMPSKESMEKLCEALGLKLEDLPLPTVSRTHREFSGSADITLNILSDQPGYGALFLRRVLPLEKCLQIIELAKDE